MSARLSIYEGGAVAGVPPHALAKAAGDSRMLAPERIAALISEPVENLQPARDAMAKLAGELGCDGSLESRAFTAGFFAAFAFAEQAKAQSAPVAVLPELPS